MAPLAPRSGTAASAADPRHHRLSGGRHETPGDVKREISPPPERVLDVLAEDREEPHVAEDVAPASVHEHRGEPAHRPRLRGVTGTVDAARIEGCVEHRRVEVWQLI